MAKYKDVIPIIIIWLFAILMLLLVFKKAIYLLNN